MLTPQEAGETLLCPLARTFGSKEASLHCRGAACAVWRWERITTSHPNWKAAVLAEAAKTGEKAPYKVASALVATDLPAFGVVPVRGFCGLGSQP